MSALSFSVLAQETLRMAVPYVCASLGGLVTERSGVPDISLEAKLLGGAFAGVAVHLATGSAWWGLGAGIATGTALGGLLAAFVAYLGVDAMVTALALNLGVAAGTRVLLRGLYQSSSNSPSIEAFRGSAEPTSSLLSLGVWESPVPWLALGVVAGVAWMFQQMPLGLRIRAAGENPSAAESRGLSVRKLRLGASLIGGAMAGLGGVALAYDQHQFQAGMSGGRGFLAIAIVILARHQPLWTAALCLAFATLDTTQIVLQDRSSIPPAFIQAAPFVVTWLALGRMRAPRSIAAR